MLNVPANADFSTWPHLTTQHHCQNLTELVLNPNDIFSLYIYIYY